MRNNSNINNSNRDKPVGMDGDTMSTVADVGPLNALNMLVRRRSLVLGLYVTAEAVKEADIVVEDR